MPSPSTWLASDVMPEPQALSAAHLTDGENDATVSVAPSRAAPSLRIVPALAIVAALWWGQAVLIPIVLSVLISYALEPPVVRLIACHLPRAVAVPVLLTALLTIGGVGAYVLRSETADFVNRLPAAAHTVAQVIQRTMRGGPGTVARVIPPVWHA